MARPDSSGRFALQLPPGRYLMRALAPGGREAQHRFEVPGGNPAVDIGSIALWN